MSVYEEFRSSLMREISGVTGDTEMFSDYQWDSLPSYPCLSHCMSRQLQSRARREISPTDPAVLYLPLGGPPAGGCPSLAETAVVGISQMTFLWTVMSVFNVVANVVANINNNQNNRNNNNNNLNINKISSQNTQISANTNNANTISIMLPPPIPVLAGGRQLEAKQRLRRFVEREDKIRRRRAGTNNTVEYEDFSEATFHVLRSLLTSGQDQPCLGRQLCHLSSSNNDNKDMTNIVVKMMTFALMWVELEDRSQAFLQFLENVTKDDFDQSLDCDLIFYKCQI